MMLDLHVISSSTTFLYVFFFFFFLLQYTCANGKGMVPSGLRASHRGLLPQMILS